MQDGDAAVVGHFGDASEAAALVAHVAILGLVAALLDGMPMATAAPLLSIVGCLLLALRRPRGHRRVGRRRSRQHVLQRPRRRGADRAAASRQGDASRDDIVAATASGRSAVFVEDVVAVDHIDQEVGGFCASLTKARPKSG